MKYIFNDRTSPLLINRTVSQIVFKLYNNKLTCSNILSANSNHLLISICSLHIKLKISTLNKYVRDIKPLNLHVKKQWNNE